MPFDQIEKRRSRVAKANAGTLWYGLGLFIVWSFWTSGTEKPDGLAIFLGALTLFVAAIVATFSRRYLRADMRVDRFHAFTLMIAASTLTLVLATNVIVLAASWCASGWLLAGLIGHDRAWSEAQAAARRARRTFLIGDLALVSAVAILAAHSGSLQLEIVVHNAASLPVLTSTAAALLLLVAAMIRCALPPFSGWLMSSMTAPTPVSALMHAGLVNAGGFLLIRYAPVLEAAPAVRIVVILSGLFAAIWGVAVMASRADIKGSLAASTVSQMGFMIMSCGLGAYGAALWHLVAHGLFKGWLFLGSGSAVGIRPARPRPFAGPDMASAILLAVFTTGAMLLLSAGKGAVLVPFFLAVFTASVALIANLRRELSTGNMVLLGAVIGGLIAIHAGGLYFASQAAGPDGPSVLPTAAAVALLPVFLVFWAWQQCTLPRSRSIPPALYVKLVNAGALRPAAKGDVR